MEVTFERRKSVAARWSWRVAVFSAVLFVVAGAGHRYGFVETVPFIAVLGLVAALALLSVLLAAIGMARLWQRGDKGGRAAAKALALVLVVLAPFAWGAFRIATLPMIHDIATDPLNPPLFSQLAGRSGAYVNPISPITPSSKLVPTSPVFGIRLKYSCVPRRKKSCPRTVPTKAPAGVKELLSAPS